MNKTEIANLALSKAREQKISGNVDTTSELIAETVLEHYENKLKETLSRVRPAFAQKRKGLARNATAPEFEWTYSYILPTDYVELVRFNGGDIKACDDYFEIEGRNLLTDEDAANIVYIRYEEDTSLYDSEFVAAFTDALAAEIINARRGDAQRAEALMQASEVKAQKSSAKAAQGRYRTNARDKILSRSRWTGTTRRISTNESTSGTQGVVIE